MRAHFLTRSSPGLRGTPARTTRGDLLKLVLALAALITVAVLLWWLADHDRVRAWKRDAQPLPFFAAMAILPVFAVPLTPFLLVAGGTFGAVTGIVGSLAAIALNVIVSYGIARGGLRPMVERVVRRTRYPIPNLDERPKSALRFALLLKLVPGIPALKQYVIALAGVPFLIYFAVCVLVTGAYAAVLVIIGESLLEHDLVKLVSADAALLALIAGAAGLYWRMKKRG